MVRRITTNGIMMSYKSNLMHSYNNLAGVTEKVTTHRQFNSYAESPSKASQAFQLRRSRWNVENQLANNKQVTHKFQQAWDCMDNTYQKLGTELVKYSSLRAQNAPDAGGRKALGEIIKGAADSVSLTWTPVFGAEGYEIYNENNILIAKTAELSYTHTDLDAITTYQYKIRPYMSSDGATYYGGFSNLVQAQTSIKKPVITLKAKKKAAVVSWKKIKGVSGYEIYRSTKKKKGYKKIKTAKKAAIVKYTNKKLTKKKKYYYKIRAYKIVDGKKVYSSYSSPKSVKAK